MPAAKLSKVTGGTFTMAQVAYLQCHASTFIIIVKLCTCMLNVNCLAQMLHAASNGGCRLVIGRRLSGGGMHVVLDLGRPDRRQEQQEQQTTIAPSSSMEAGVALDSSHSTSSNSTIKAASAAVAVQAAKEELSSAADDALVAMKYASVQLRDGIDTVILGSEGLW